MERNLNKEFRDYAESFIAGLSLKQCAFAVLAIGISVIVYASLVSVVSTDVLIWICILAAAPLVAFGFVRYQGMSCFALCKLLIRFYKTPRKLVYRGENTHYELLKKGGAFPHEHP